MNNMLKLKQEMINIMEILHSKSIDTIMKLKSLKIILNIKLKNMLTLKTYKNIWNKSNSQTIN